MKTINLFLLGLFFMCSTVVANADNVTKLIKGTWIVQVPDAPYGYQDYKITVKEVEGEYRMDILSSEINLKNQKMVEKEGKLTAEIYVGEFVNTTIWEEEGIVKGLADTSMGKLPITFKKDKK